MAAAFFIRPLRAEDLTPVLRLALLVREAPSWSFEDFRKLTETPPGPAATGTVAVPEARLLRRAFIAERTAEITTNYPLLGLAVVQCLHIPDVDPMQAEIEAELESILVHPDARRQSIGSKLLEAATDWCRSQHASILRLEVRSSNEAARSLYQRHGFQSAGHRPGYYHHPEEDAVLMELLLAHSPLS